MPAKAESSQKRSKSLPTIPPAFSAALRKNKKAFAAFEKFPPSHKRAYVEWVTDAQLAETRRRRIAAAVRQIAEGK